MKPSEAINILENAMDFSEFDNDEIIENEEWRAQQCLITYVKLLQEENRKLKEDWGL